eukprot:c14308_g1_i2 orf=420-890(+)
MNLSFFSVDCRLESYFPMSKVRDNPDGELKEGMEPMRKKVDEGGLERPSALYCWSVVIGMLALLGCAFIPPPFLGPLECLRSFYLFFFRTRGNLQTFFVVANLIHLGLATFAFFVARRVDSLHAAGWFWQTFIFGHGSFKLLLLRQSQNEQCRKEH